VPPEWAGGEAAATEWERRGQPYERALELVDTDEPERISEGLVLLDGLGAQPAAAIARARLRKLGVTRIPRGPRPQTRENVAGLTERQQEVVGFLAQGLTNAEIAQRLVVSVRTGRPPRHGGAGQARRRLPSGGGPPRDRAGPV
jgi:hypothetical protein